MKRQLLGELVAAIMAKRGVVLATRLATAEQTLLFPFEPDAAPPDPDWPAAAARQAILDDRSATVVTPAGETFLRPYSPPIRLIIVGAVHIAVPLARMAAISGLDVRLVDPRPVFASEERFPGVQVIRDWPAEAMAALRPDHRTAVVTLTHDARLDDAALLGAFGSEAFYIGALGSHRTHQKRIARLRDLGVADRDLARIRAPVGLDIGARTPEEIAVAVLAELVAQRRGKVHP